MDQTRVVINGEEYLVPSQTTGRQIKDKAGIASNRALIRQSPGRDDAEIIPNSQSIEVSDAEYFSDAPAAEYGWETNL